MSSVEIFVDDKSLTVNKDGNLIEELKRYNIEIPHFCYHPELGIDGNCRMCLIEVKGQKRPQIACNTPISEGMEIYVSSELTRSVQRANLELELINHPIDCPVCDQAGECDLQNYYMKFDLAKSQMKLKNKVTKGKKFYYGKDVVHDQERCVLCTRCVRFTETVTKTKELGLQKRGDESRIIIFPGRPIYNRYAGNIIQICPVGAMTSKDFRFKKRVWHLEPVESICQGCAKGCAIYIDHYQEKYESDRAYRFRARRDDKVNGSFICDDGRYSHHQENENRAKAASYEYPLYQIRQALEKHQSKCGIIVSANLSTEELFFVKTLSVNYETKLSGYSDFCIGDDGDDYLIQNDKASNRASLDLLDIDASLATYQEILQSCEYLLLFSQGEPNADLLQDLQGKQYDAISSHNFADKEVIACKSFSEREGHTINCDKVIRKMNQAVSNNEVLSTQEIIEKILERKLSFAQELLRGFDG